MEYKYTLNKKFYERLGRSNEKHPTAKKRSKKIKDLKKAGSLYKLPAVAFLLFTFLLAYCTVS